MLNKVMIIGHVGQDPEVRYTGNATNGTKVATLRVATSEKYKDKDGNVKDSKDIVKSLKTEWADFIVTEGVRGASTSNPPANTGGGKMSKDEIMKIKDTAERQQAMLENKDLFLN